MQAAQLNYTVSCLCFPNNRQRNSTDWVFWKIWQAWFMVFLRCILCLIVKRKGSTFLLISYCMNLYCNVAPLKKKRGRGRMGINYTLAKMYNRFEIENCCFSMQSRKPQLIAFLTTDTMLNFVELQHIMTLMQKPFHISPQKHRCTR